MSNISTDHLSRKKSWLIINECKELYDLCQKLKKFKIYLHENFIRISSFLESRIFWIFYAWNLSNNSLIEILCSVK